MNAPHDLMQAQRLVPPALLQALQAHFGTRCSGATAVREQHGRDESPYPTTPPELVLFCESTADVAFAVHQAAPMG